MADLSLEQADIIARVTLEKARGLDAQPLTVVVLDAGGHVKLAKREDGSGIVRFEIAYGKAWGALGMGISSRGLAARAAKMGTFFNALAAASDGRMVPVPGGVLVRDADSRIIGAVGVSGDTSDVDETCALAGIAAAGLVADTEER
ncbi:GlcG/HbpS family heme-binding protein [Ancylobacter mangrovi]|uniref:GlcG/HbpS family heme-binding protein n=1 Tax=Ancylobacter mangrovi TaxID=2972472 RepID=UPI0021615145|nr:heme-binding protein [Ancylobacter mangrovi]MCS0504261.1 heme-binding protein [Ancylobacter mangrovi]